MGKRARVDDDEARPSSKSTPGAKKQKKTVAAKSLLLEKGMNLAEIEDDRFVDIIQEKNWLKLVACPVQANETLVKEFYKVAVKDLDTKGFTVRGREVKITSEVINEYYGVAGPSEGIKNGLDIRIYDVKEFAVLKAFENPSNVSKDVVYSELSVSDALFINMLRVIILPRKSASRLEDIEKQFLICIRRGWKINIGEMILSYMKKLITNLEKMPKKQQYLYFPSLITGLLKDMNVPISKRDVLADELDAIGATLMNQIKTKRGGKDTPQEVLPTIRKARKVQVGGTSSSATPAANESHISEGNVHILLEAINGIATSLKGEIRKAQLELEKEMKAQVQALCENWKEEFLASIEDPVRFAAEWKKNKDQRLKKTFGGFSRFSTMESQSRTVPEAAAPREEEHASPDRSVNDPVDHSDDQPTNEFSDHTDVPIVDYFVEEPAGEGEELVAITPRNSISDPVTPVEIEEQIVVDQSEAADFPADCGYQMVVYHPPAHLESALTNFQQSSEQVQQLVSVSAALNFPPLPQSSKLSIRRHRGPVQIGDADDVTVQEGEEIPNPEIVDVNAPYVLQAKDKQQKLKESPAKKRVTRSAVDQLAITPIPTEKQYKRKKLIKKKLGSPPLSRLMLTPENPTLDIPPSMPQHIEDPDTNLDDF